MIKLRGCTVCPVPNSRKNHLMENTTLPIKIASLWIRGGWQVLANSYMAGWSRSPQNCKLNYTNSSTAYPFPRVFPLFVFSQLYGSSFYWLEKIFLQKKIASFIFIRDLSPRKVISLILVSVIKLCLDYLGKVEIMFRLSQNLGHIDNDDEGEAEIMFRLSG